MSLPVAILLALGGLALGIGIGWMLAARSFGPRLAQALGEARTDPLTGLWNRKSFDEHLVVLLSIARRYLSPLSLVMLDVDHLKQINDRFGHAAGDAALEHVGRVLRGSVRDSDVVARIGGDEFALLLPQTDSQGAAALGTRIREALGRTPVDWPGRDPVPEATAENSESIAVLASTGIATFQENDTAADLLERADRDLYQAKRALAAR